MKFRKKPVVIEANQFDGSSTGKTEIEDWMGGKGFNRRHVRTQDLGRVVEIPTLEGVMTASAGDWIICGVKGEFYPCKSDIFEATYEAVE